MRDRRQPQDDILVNLEPKRRSGRALAALLTITTVVGAGARPALATPTAPASRYASIVMEAETGNVLYERNADLPRYPASLTKMMTLYMAFEALAAKKLALTDQLTFSEHAVSRDPSRLDLTPGSKLKVEDAIRAMTTKSANDAACALGEALAGGSEERFAAAMTAKAKALGMKHTTFRNASGLPDDKHVTTARDLAILGKALVHDYPDYYRYFSTQSFDWRGMRYPNQNRFLHTYYGADGIKTGFVNASGHNLAASAVRGGKRLIAVVLGGDTQTWTREHASRLLDVSYAKIDPSLVMVASNETATPPAATAAAGAAGGIAPAAPAAPAATTTQTYSTPAGAVTITTPAAPAIALPNATANLADYAAAASAPKAPAGSVGPAPAVAPAVYSDVPTRIPTAPPARTAKPAPAVAKAPSPAPAKVATAKPGVHTEILDVSTAPVAAKPAAAPATPAASATAQAAAAPAPAATAAPSREASSSQDRTTGAHTGNAPVSEDEIAREMKAKNIEIASLPAAKPAAATSSVAVASTPQAAPKAPEYDNAHGRGEWAVQVGLFRDATIARRRGEEARNQMPPALRGADLVVGRAQDGVHVTSRIGRLSEQDAREACSQLQRGRVPCVVVPPGRPLIVATNEQAATR